MNGWRDWLGKCLKQCLKLQFVISICILGAVIALALEFHNEFAHKTDVSVKSVQIEAARTGGFLVYDATLCNSSDHIIDVSYSLHFLSDNGGGGGREVTIASQLSASLRPKTCTDPPIHNLAKLPDTIDAGKWRLRLVVFSTPQGLLNLISGTSEPFEVEPK